MDKFIITCPNCKSTNDISEYLDKIKNELIEKIEIDIKEMKGK